MTKAKAPVNNYRTSDKVREKHPNAKLTQIQVDEIRKLASQGVTTAMLMARFGIGKTAINDIKNYKTWKPLEVKVPDGINTQSIE